MGTTGLGLFRRETMAFSSDFWRRGPRNSPPGLRRLGFSARLWRPLTAGLGGFVETPFQAGWSRRAFSASPENTSGACAPSRTAKPEPEVARQLVTRGADW